MLPRKQLQSVTGQKLVLIISSSIVGQEKVNYCVGKILITALDTILSLGALCVMVTYTQTVCLSDFLL